MSTDGIKRWADQAPSYEEYSERCKIKAKVERLSGCCQAIREYGKEARIAFPLPPQSKIISEGILADSKEPVHFSTYLAAEWIARNFDDTIRAILVSTHNTVEEVRRYYTMGK